MGLFGGYDDTAIRSQLERIERKLDALLSHAGLASPDDLDDIRALIARGEVIAAIKAYRARTGASLADAKNAVERGL